MFNANISKFFSGFRDIVSNARRLLKIIWPEKKGTLVFYMFLLILGTADPFIRAGANGLLLNELVKTVSGGMATDRLAPFIALFLITYIIPFISNELLNFYSRIFFLYLGEKFDLLLIRHRGTMDVVTHEDPKFADLFLKLFENGVWRIQNFSDRQMYILSDILGVILGSSIIAAINWKIFILIFVTTIPVLIVEAKYGQKVWSIFSTKSEIRRKYANLRWHFLEPGSFTEIKLFQNVEHFFSVLKGMYHNFMREQVSIERRMRTYRFIGVGISEAAIIVAMLVFLREVIQGHMQIGTYTFILTSIISLRRSFSSLFRNIGRQYGDSLFVTDLFKFLDIQPKIISPKQAIILDKKKVPEIAFENVTFAYPNTDKQVLKDVSFRFVPGQRVALIGLNGAGKTTLIKLLCRFYDPDKGRILVDGHDLRDIDLDSWYAKLGAIFQDYSHYDFYVKDAIAIGRTSKKSDLEAIKKAAKAAEADVFIEEWEKSYDQMLGRAFHGGVEPSIGQWQKLALARLFYRDPQIMILDEPTSSIDPEAEARIFERIEQQVHERTVILISHRFSTVRSADMIFVISDGKITEQGTHDELLKKNKTYARLFRLQARGYK